MYSILNSVEIRVLTHVCHLFLKTIAEFSVNQIKCNVIKIRKFVLKSFSNFMNINLYLYYLLNILLVFLFCSWFICIQVATKVFYRWAVSIYSSKNLQYGTFEKYTSTYKNLRESGLTFRKIIWIIHITYIITYINDCLENFVFKIFGSLFDNMRFKGNLFLYLLVFKMFCMLLIKKICIKHFFADDLSYFY